MKRLLVLLVLLAGCEQTYPFTLTDCRTICEPARVHSFRPGCSWTRQTYRVWCVDEYADLGLACTCGEME